MNVHLYSMGESEATPFQNKELVMQYSITLPNMGVDAQTLAQLAVEAETAVCLVAAVSAAAGKLAAAAMPPPAIKTLRREARAGISSFNRESSWLVCVGSFNSMPRRAKPSLPGGPFCVALARIARTRLNRFKLNVVSCKRISSHTGTHTCLGTGSCRPRRTGR